MSVIAGEMDALRISLGEVEADSAIAAESFDRADWAMRTRSTSIGWPACWA